MSTRIYIGRVSHRAREKDIERFVKGYGKVRDVTLKNGYGFVEFDDPQDADDAVYELNGKELLSERVIVELARGPTSRSNGSRNDRYDRDRDRRPPPFMQSRRPKTNERYGPPTRTDYRVIVENLSSRVSWQDLKDYMRTAGEVTYADAHKLRKNEGVVEFATSEDLKNAISKLDDTELSGRRIRLVAENPKRRRSKSKSRSRSRSYSRSRSHSKSISRSKSKSRERSRSRSKSPQYNHSASRSRSISQHDGNNMDQDNERSRSRSYNGAVETSQN